MSIPHTIPSDAQNARTLMTVRLWDSVADRLFDLRGSFKRILVIGLRPPLEVINHLADQGKIDPTHITFVSADADVLPVEPGIFDAVLSVSALHTAADVPMMLLQMRYALTSGGVMIAAFPGGETLRELRDVLTTAELQLRAGAQSRLAAMIEARAFAGLMQQAGFLEPVVDIDREVIEYHALITLLNDIRDVRGARMMGQGFAPRALFRTAEELYRCRYATSTARLPATLDVLYAIGWAPV